MRSSATSRYSAFFPFTRLPKNEEGEPAQLPNMGWTPPWKGASSQEAFRVQTRMFQSVLDSMSDGIVVADTAGKFLVWNAAAEKILGTGPLAVPVEQWSATFGLYEPIECKPFPTDQLPLARAIQGESSKTEMMVRTPGTAKSAWIEVTAHPLKDENGKIIGGVAAIHDITERTVSEMKIRKLNDELETRVRQRTAQLEETNKELESFTYSVAHDLRAPLRHISGFAQILVEDFSPSLDPSLQEYLARIQQGTRRMGQLVDELLNLARVGRKPLVLQEVDFTAMSKKVIEDFLPMYEGRDVQWAVHELPSAGCDAALMKQVFQNLISNAIKYTRARAKAVIEIGCETANEQVAIFVRDNGVGFNMKYAGKLFGIFQRLHNSEDFEGTGVGLATVQRIIQKHGGRVWAAAKPNHGATFYFSLPGLKSGQDLNSEMLGACNENAGN
jgi:signal transduction histidine kinase